VRLSQSSLVVDFEMQWLVDAAGAWFELFAESAMSANMLCALYAVHIILELRYKNKINGPLLDNHSP
jgi:hypothetical protein